MKKLSIKLRVTIWYTLIIIIISGMALFVMTSLNRKMLIQESTARVRDSVTGLARSISSPPDKPNGGTDGSKNNNDGSAPPPELPANGETQDAPVETPPAGTPPPVSNDGKTHRDNGGAGKMSAPNFFENGVHMAVYDSSHTLVDGFMPFEFADDITLADDDLQDRVYGGSSYVTYVKQVTAKDGTEQWIVGVVSVDDQSSTLRSVITTNLILTAVLVAAAALGGYMIVKRAFAPVEKIRKTAESISESSDLSQRIALGQGNDEIYRLAETFDQMLSKLETMLENEKQFTSDASHELRTPVAVITSECEYAMECADTKEDMIESITAIKRQSDKMSKLISELLTISRMDRNTSESVFETVNVSELLAFVCDEQEEIHSGDIKLIRAIAPNVTAYADHMMLARLFVNLISNAYKYGRQDGKITVTLEEDSENIVAVIEDDGIGIAVENLPKIWERFYRADESRSGEDGSMGLGLAMVKQIAERHNGKMSVRSELGRGTAFTFVMPKSPQ